MNKLMHPILFFLAISFFGGAYSHASRYEGYWHFSRNCADELEYFSWGDPDDWTCSTFLPTVILSDVVSIPSYAYLDFIKWLNRPADSRYRYSDNSGSSTNKQSFESLTTPTEKKAPQNEIPEERKIDRNRLSLLQAAVDDSVQYLTTKQTTPLLLATFKQVEQFFAVSNPEVDKYEAYAEALIKLNNMVLNYEMNLENALE